MNITKVAQIARREYLARVRSKAFIFFTLLPPIIMALSGSLVPLLTRADIDELRLAVIDVGTGIGEPLAARLAESERLPIVLRDSVTVSEGDKEKVRGQFSDAVRQGELDGYLLIQPDDEAFARARYYARETGNPVVLATLERAVTTSVLETWFSGEQLDRIRRVQRADLAATTISAEGEESGGFLVAYASTMLLGMLLYMAVLIQGQQMATAIVEEKSSRLVELIIGAVTATEYMVGKVVGVLGTGLTQLAIWLGFIAVAVLYVLPGLAVAATLTDFDLSQLLDPGLIGYLVIFFLLGYFLYTTLFAAAGATCSSTEVGQTGHSSAPLEDLLVLQEQRHR